MSKKVNMTTEYIRIKQPREFDKLNEAELLERFTKKRTDIQTYVQRISEDKYRFWDKAQHKKSAEGFTNAESWFLAREIRKISSRAIPVRTSDGQHFTWLRLNYTDELLRKIDMYAGGNFMLDTKADNDSVERQKYLTRGIMEEAIASSQLEGANTSRRYAKKMIAENIKPRNTSEWMILNNYNALSKIDEEYKDSELSRELLLELHAQLTQNTLDNVEEAKRFRKDSDDIVVMYGGNIAHVPPDEENLNIELDRFIKYANDRETFTHPVVKAIILHFWMGYLHPFTDGNGRLARAIFYWYMLKNEYWAMVYLPISLVIKRAPSQYAYSYIYAEQDNLDFTYFYDYNIKKIIKAIEEFTDFANRVINENKDIDAKLKAYRANSRQKQLIHYLLADDSNHASILSHTRLNGISRQTAYRDLSDLEENDLVVTEKVGKTVRYYASDKLKELAKTTD